MVIDAKVRQRTFRPCRVSVVGLDIEEVANLEAIFRTSTRKSEHKSDRSANTRATPIPPKNDIKPNCGVAAKDQNFTIWTDAANATVLQKDR